MMLQKPKGLLVPIGGNKKGPTSNKEILRRVIEETGKANLFICLITLASDTPEQTETEYRNIFAGLGVYNISVINFHIHTEADSLENLERAKNADIVLFCDGNQLKLSSLLGGTHLIARIKKRYLNENNFVVVGIGAGATVMSNTMIISCGSNDAMLKGELELNNGFNLISSVFMDTHFAERGRFGCLVQAVAFNPAVLGIGLNENTALVIKDEEVEVIGSGIIVIVDGTSIEYSDLTEIEHGDPITVGGIKMNFISTGNRFLIHKKQIQKSTKGFLELV